MIPHVKIYMNHFGIHESDDWYCESCGKMDNIRNFDIHHIISRSVLANPEKYNRIGNLQNLCRACHDSRGHNKEWRPWLFRAHKLFMQKHDKEADMEWIDEQLQKCS